MDRSKSYARLPLAATLLGALGFVLRRVLYAVAMDGPWLLEAGHPLETVLWIVTAGTLLLLAIAVWKLDGSAVYEHNFAPSRLALAGHILFAVGILLTVLGSEPLIEGFLGSAWTICGYAAVPCLIWAGIWRLTGKKAMFLTHMIPCLFLMFHIINNYRDWNSAPQLQSYGFSMFGTMALMFFCFYLTAFDVDLGKRRMLLFYGMAAVYLCLTALARTASPWLYLGGAAFAGTSLCALQPTPREEAPETAEDGESGDAPC